MRTDLLRKLPHDIQALIWKHVHELRTPKVVLSRELRRDIKTHRYLSRILDNYKSLDPDYASLWVEHAMIKVLNEGRPLYEPGFTPCFRTIFPNCTDADIKDRLLIERDLTERLWCAMDTDQRTELLSTSVELHTRLGPIELAALAV